MTAFLTMLRLRRERADRVEQMKVDQETLERRLWARQEKVKAEHERQIKGEQDMCVVSFETSLDPGVLLIRHSARIARRPIPPEKRQVHLFSRLSSASPITPRTRFLNYSRLEPQLSEQG
jgi:hypothetical protein